MTTKTKYAKSASSEKKSKREVAKKKTEKVSKGDRKRPKRKAAKKTGFTTGMKNHWGGGRDPAVFVTSSDLVSALNRVMRLEEDYESRGDRWYILEADLRVKYRRLEKLIEKDPSLKKTLGSLMAYLRAQVAARIEIFQKNKDEGYVLFEDLWLLYYEGQEVFYDDNGALVAGVVERANPGSGLFGRYYGMRIKCLIHDGQKFVEEEKYVAVGGFDGGERLANLTVRLVTPDLKEHFIERGARVSDIIQAGSSYVQYAGECIERSWWGTKRYRADGRCMLDPKTFKKMNENYDHPHNRCEEEERDGTKFREIVRDDLWRVAPWIPGFSFAAKQWGEFNIENVTPINFNTDAFDQLVLPARNVEGLEVDPKRMIRSLVEKGTVGFTDVIAGKGCGIILLLHGPPGTGKTLTAEAIADLLRRPLYSVSVGELGTKTEVLEKNLRTVLEVATLWKAVLLIDEADIFMEKRTARDIERNALVAIFLRMLEYYQGVLFLTTNRVKEFDRAFNSRISIALHYPAHDTDNRTQIWTNLLRVAKLDPSGFDVATLAKEEVNGRQIQHAIRIGLSLAANEERPVTAEDFMKTIRLAQYFNRQLETPEVMGEDLKHVTVMESPMPMTALPAPGKNGGNQRRRRRI